MIRVDGVEVSFGDVTVLDGIDLRVDPGEFVALVGPNGAGKSTLLRAINGLLDPDVGEIWLDDSRVSEMSSRAVSRTLATVPQDTHVGFSFRAEEIVEMGRTPHRSRLDWSDDGDPVDAALERTETTPLRDRRIDDVSGGERQRILLARALAQEPDALLLDEPTASLDINHQIGVLDLVSDLVAEGRAALAAIHDLDLAARYCDRLLLLYDGTIAASGPPDTVLRDSTLADAFETETAVTRNPVTGTPTVSALSDRPSREEHVHVTGGGQEAARAVRSLWRAGYEVSVGLAPEGDVVTKLADHLDVEVVSSPAFERPSDAARRAAIETAKGADAVVITEGPGSEPIADAVESDSVVETAFESAGTAFAQADGGSANVVGGESELVEVVSEAVTRRPSVTDSANR